MELQIGVEGLRVIDYSVTANTVLGDTSGPAVAVGWRAGDLVVEDRRRP